MQCPGCNENLVVLRRCRKIRLHCQRCGKEYQIHEVAHLLDEETEMLLGPYTCIIYD